MLKRLTLMVPILLGAAVARADVTIGVALPRTGSFASVGDQVLNGVQEAAKLINDKGGVLGQRVALDVEDDACDPRQAVSVANRLVVAGVRLVVGHVCSGASMAASDVYNENGVVMVTPASNLSKLTERGMAEVFRVCGRDDRQGLFAAQVIAQRWGKDRIAILHDNQAFGRGLAEATRDNLHQLGVQEMLFDSITPGERDYRSVISRLKQAGVQLVYYGGYQQEMGLLVRQAAEQGLAAQWFGTSGISTTEFAQIAGPAGNGVLFTFNPDPRKAPEAAPVVAAFKARGIDPLGFTLYGYASVQVLAEAVAKAGSADPGRVAATLHAEVFESVLGPARFDAKGDIEAPGYRLYVWKDGAFDYAP